MSKHSGRSVFIVQAAHRGPQSERDQGVASAEIPFPLRNRKAVPTFAVALG
jgi:hypothetical protein